MFWVGCHLSASKGYLAMGKMAEKIGANTFQFFTRNPRGGSVKALDLEDIAAYRAFAAQKGFGKILAHAPYTMNACALMKVCGNLPQTSWRRIWTDCPICRKPCITSTPAAM